MARPRRGDDSPRLKARAVRLPPALDAAVERHAVAMRERDPYAIPATWSDALRELVQRGLESVGTEAAPATAPKRKAAAKVSAKRDRRRDEQLALRRVMGSAAQRPRR